MMISLIVPADIWRVIVSDGVVRHFEDRMSAEFYAKDCAQCGFTTMLHGVSFPDSRGAYVDMLDRIYEAIRIRESGQ